MSVTWECMLIELTIKRVNCVVMSSSVMKCVFQVNTALFLCAWFYFGEKIPLLYV